MLDQDSNQNILQESIKSIMEDAFFDYAKYVLEDRALPDLRDGLKPVHRRTLYAMFDMGNDHNRPYKKSARIVGDVIGKYHPHGDSSVYGAAVRMAQTFSMREPLIDGQGNFGSIDGDSPAAMRYTEIRLTRLASEMFADINKETVDWEMNYDGQERLPSILCAPYPNLLVNGVDSIAVGMASSIPPHNLTAVCESAIKLVEQGQLTAKEMFDILEGPDYPTGGLMYGVEGLLTAIESGFGRTMLRSKYEVEQRSNVKGAQRLVITEIPYQVNKAKLVAKIADLVKERKVEDIVALRDESNKKGIRVAIDLKAGADAHVIFSTLCKLNTNLEVSVNYNCTVLDGGIPVQLGMLEILTKWLSFRRDVVTKRFIFERKKAQEKLHLMAGLIKALDRLDEVITLIRAAQDSSTAKTQLMSLLEIDDLQAQAILDMRLQKLTGLEINDIRKSYEDLVNKISELTLIIESPKAIDDVITNELKEVQTRYGGPRLTEIGHHIENITHEDLIERQNVFIAVTKNGYIKRMPEDAFVKQNRGTRGKKAMTLGDDDESPMIYASHSHDTVLVFSQTGQVYGIKAYQIPEANNTSKGRHIKNVIEGLEDEVASIINVPEAGENLSIVVVTSDGTVKRSSLDAYSGATRKGGVIGLNLEDGNAIVDVFVCQNHDHLMMISSSGNAIRFDIEDVRIIGRTATGVKGMGLNQGDRVIGAYVIKGNGYPLAKHMIERIRDDQAVMVEELDTRAMDERNYLVCIGEKGVGKRTAIAEFSVQARAGKGVRCFNINNKTGALTAAFGATLENDVIMFATNGVSNRIGVDAIRETGRSAAGVILMNLDDGAVINSVAIAQKQEAEQEDLV